MNNKFLKLAVILVALVSLLVITDIVLEKIAASRTQTQIIKNV